MGLSVWVFFAVGLILLVAGADIMVRGASRLAAIMGVSPLVIGLTVVAFGTSAPEMAVSVQSAFTGQAGSDMAIGNVVGSNIFNVLFILGLSAAIAPLTVSQQLIRIDVPIMIGVSVLMFLFSLDKTIGRLDGIFLFGGIIAYTVFAIRQSRKESDAVQGKYAREYGGTAANGKKLAVNLGFVLAGLAMLVWGARWLVDSAIVIARAFQVSELIIGLTIVAGGTSLPEVATSVMASIKGERDIAVGNVVGSSIFNILAVLGLVAIATPGGVPVAASAFRFDIPVMVAVSIACLPIFFTGYTIERWEGFLFLGYYAAYTAFLLLSAERHRGIETFAMVMLYFVIPLTAVTVAISVVRHYQKKNDGSSS